MNRILFEANEIREDGTAVFGGERAAHVREFLHGEVGQTIKTGVVDGPVGTSRIVALGDDGTVTVAASHASASLAPWADLILAPPRPRAFRRLLPQLAALGVGRIVLVGAKKVEKDFWGATILKPETYRPLLVDGLMQAGTTALPSIETRRNFRRFAADELDAMFPTGWRVVAHPYAGGGDKVCDPRFEAGGSESLGGLEGSTTFQTSQASHQPRTTNHEPPATNRQTTQRLLLAIGPEGGWTEEEVSLLESRGFSRLSLGPRILRTETATVGLLVKLNSES